MDKSLLDRFMHYPPTSDRVAQNHEFVRGIIGAAANQILPCMSDGREKALVLTKLEEAIMWANAGIARSQTPIPEEIYQAIKQEKAKQDGDQR